MNEPYRQETPHLGDAGSYSSQGVRRGELGGG